MVSTCHANKLCIFSKPINIETVSISMGQEEENEDISNECYCIISTYAIDPILLFYYCYRVTSTYNLDHWHPISNI